MCCLPSAFAFITHADIRRVQLWGSVVKELRWCAALVPFCCRHLTLECVERLTGIFPTDLDHDV